MNSLVTLQCLYAAELFRLKTYIPSDLLEECDHFIFTIAVLITAPPELYGRFLQGAM